MFDKLKQKKEKRGQLFETMQSLFDSAEKESRDFTEAEETQYNQIDAELKQLDDDIAKLENMEERKKQLALEAQKSKQKEDEVQRTQQDQGKQKDEHRYDVTANNLKKKEARNQHVFKMIQGFVTRDIESESEARKKLVEGGHYDDYFEGIPSEQRNFSTLKDGKGGILIPTQVSNEIFDIEQEYGVVPRLAMNFGDIGKGRIKVPQILSRPTFSAVNEGAAISGSGLNLGGISLNTKKWGCIVDWTNEVGDEVGARLLPILQRKIAEGLAFIKDDTFINGDGTSSYNGIKGLTSLVGNVNYVRQATAATGNVSFATLDADDFLKPQENTAPGTRSKGVYIMHPNMIFTLKKLKDGQGMYIYGAPSEMAPVGTLFGYPIELTEAFNITDGTLAQVCAFFNPDYLAYANGRGLSAKQLDQATITNEDGTSVNLATQDAQAIRFTALFDLVLSTVTRTTAGTAQGAFSLLRTNNS